MNTESNIFFDEKLKKIYGLKWFPWVGSQYTSTKTKLLVVGESHYVDGTPEKIKEFDSPMATRECVQEMGVDDNLYNVKLYKNIFLTLANSSSISTEVFWSRVCFHNFVQKTMADINVRPDWPSFRDSSSQFLSLVEVLKPNYCLFCGVTAYNAVLEILKSTGVFNVLKNSVYGKMSGTYPRSIIIHDRTGHEIVLVFIKHPSKYYSYEDWGDFIEIEFPYIKSIFYDTYR